MPGLKVKAISPQRLSLSFLWFPMSFGKKFSNGTLKRFLPDFGGEFTKLIANKLSA
ncbi:hypothetical protein [Crinalium epipsammum]|uniref:hypothetical protein n=1 Tax=Crinalium epipsammum TaxID=241425 RepID=UPI00030BFE1F|nr:hypothetical protein [Crinalium epipsammum]